jgi:hypothetical protein
MFQQSNDLVELKRDFRRISREISDIQKMRAVRQGESEQTNRKRRLAAVRFETTLMHINAIEKAGFNPGQARVPAGSREGGQWTDNSDAGESADVQNILDEAKRLAASHAEIGRCVDLCLPLLNRRQARGSNRNEFDFRKCLNACLGINQ